MYKTYPTEKTLRKNTMSNVSLKSLLNKRKPTAGLLENLAADLQAPFSVQDDQGRWVLGEPRKDAPAKFPIQQGGMIIGWVHGEIKTEPLAALLTHLVEKESDKKQIGAEVLDLYREINLIYNFSEKLATALDAEMIAQTALEEVRQVIDASGGAVIFLPETEDPPRTLATLGAPFFKEEDLTRKGALNQFLLSGQANIRNGINDQLNPGLMNAGSLLYAPLKVKHRLLGLIILAHEEPVEYKAAHLKLLTTLALQSASAIESALLFQKRIQEAREREEAIRRIHEVTTRFVPYEFISALGREKLTEVMLGDQVLREVTVFFSDIREYTALAESMTPEDNFRFVNAYNGRMGPVIYENAGFVNQYLGDGIMAIFPKSPSDALRAAIEMQRVLHTYNLERIDTGRQPIKVGMGLHTGPLIMGIIGDVQRMEAATIADTVNTAARIESLTKYYGVNILLSGDCIVKSEVLPESAIAEAGGNRKSEVDAFNFRYLGEVQVKGKREPVAIYECFDGDAPEQVEKKNATADIFSEAMRDYYNRNFRSAAQALKSILAVNPDDRTAKILLNRMEGYLHTGVPDDWTGVEKMSVK